MDVDIDKKMAELEAQYKQVEAAGKRLVAQLTQVNNELVRLQGAIGVLKELQNPPLALVETPAS